MTPRRCGKHSTAMDTPSTRPGSSWEAPNGASVSPVLVSRRWIYRGKSGWAKRARKHFGQTCEVCGITGNYRGGVHQPDMQPDLAHLIAKTELERYGEMIGKPFL